jgi:hypothetical protein
MARSSGRLRDRHLRTDTGGRGWSYHNGGPVEVTFTAHVTDEGGATRLEVDLDGTPHGLFVLFFPIFMRMMRRQEVANMTNLKNSIEGARIP